ncbi:MAG: pyrroline-5-carboxylate reductase [Spirochaetaceae bacterium]|nr:pyrroline-5-carboxylate reductase [Spirochaetaceae bacterium]
MGKKLGIIGAGKIGEALAMGVIRKGLLRVDDMILSVRSETHRAELEARTGIKTVLDNLIVAREADTLILAVKPKAVTEIIAEIKAELGPDKLLISTAAGVSLDLLESTAPVGAAVIRTMPNMAVAIGEGMTVLSPGKAVSQEKLAWATELFRATGRALVLEEQYMDAVTGLSGSGPAYVYIIIESLADGGLKLGLPRDVATELAAQTVLGAARNVLVTGEHPAKLKDQVTTPAGVTIDGILELEAGRLRVTLINAVVKAAERARQLLHKPH